MGSRGSGFERRRRRDNGEKKAKAVIPAGLTKKEYKHAQELADIVSEYHWNYTAPGPLTKEAYYNEMINRDRAGRSLRQLVEMADKIQKGAGRVLLHPYGVPDKHLWEAIDKIENILGVKLK